MFVSEGDGFGSVTRGLNGKVVVIHAAVLSLKEFWFSLRGNESCPGP